MQRLIDGEVDEKDVEDFGQPLLVTQQKAAHLLGVNRVTIWRMAKAGLLHPVEILRGTQRYRLREVAALASNGTSAAIEVIERPKKKADSR